MQLLVLLSLVGAAFAAALPSEAPLPVEDTEDVAKAKEEFDVAFKAAAAAAEADEVPEVVTAVEYTPEVAKARADFQAAYDAAALAAEIAPDFDVDGKLSTYSGFLSTVDGRLSPFYTNAFPFGAYGFPAPIAPVVQSAPASPIAYTGLGLPGFYGYPGFYGFPGPFAVAAAPEAEEEVAVKEA